MTTENFRNIKWDKNLTGNILDKDRRNENLQFYEENIQLFVAKTQWNTFKMIKIKEEIV